MKLKLLRKVFLLNLKILLLSRKVAKSLLWKIMQPTLVLDFLEEVLIKIIV